MYLANNQDEPSPVKGSTIDIRETRLNKMDAVLFLHQKDKDLWIIYTGSLWVL